MDSPLLESGGGPRAPQFAPTAAGVFSGSALLGSAAFVSGASAAGASSFLAVKREVKSVHLFAMAAAALSLACSAGASSGVLAFLGLTISIREVNSDRSSSPEPLASTSLKASSTLSAGTSSPMMGMAFVKLSLDIESLPSGQKTAKAAFRSSCEQSVKSALTTATELASLYSASVMRAMTLPIFVCSAGPRVHEMPALVARM
mmetsp:Transcript_44084/g.114654  ORF Transcript_44084/g.114654 Transcript_44084/m.114654 type:complete len:203 (+) Transcript_44084:193-801(+)